MAITCPVCGDVGFICDLTGSGTEKWTCTGCETEIVVKVTIVGEINLEPQDETIETGVFYNPPTEQLKLKQFREKTKKKKVGETNAGR